MLKILFLISSLSVFVHARDFYDITLEEIKNQDGFDISIEKKEIASWTLIFFINAKNDLESFAMMDVNQLELAGSDYNINVIVQAGRMNGQIGDDNSDGNWGPGQGDTLSLRITI